MTQNPASLKCPFRNTLITRDYGCEFASEVTHRDGPGIVCGNEAAHQRCQEIFNSLKLAALPVLEVIDDLTQMPASVISKIQYGGLQGLAAMIDQQTESIDNINGLLKAVLEHYQALDAIDFNRAAVAIQDYRLRKRRR